MTFGFDTITPLPRIHFPGKGATFLSFVGTTSSTADVSVSDEERQDELVEKLISLTLNPDSLDWDLLARIDIEGWGTQADPE